MASEKRQRHKLDRYKRELELELLILRCQRGERAAFQTLAYTWSDRLFVYVRRLVEDEHDAWDVVQQTWVRVLRRIRSLRDTDRFPAWVYRIARNAALNHRRAKGYRDMKPLEAVEEPAEDEECEFEDAETVYQGIDKLTLAHQEVLTLFFLRDLSIAEIGAVLDVPSGTVKSRIHYAKRALREVLNHGEMRHE